MFQNIGEMVVLFWRTLVALPLSWRHREKVFDQFFEIGNASLLMVCILSFFIGGVIALQTGPLLVERGLGGYVGGIVGFSSINRVPKASACVYSIFHSAGPKPPRRPGTRPGLRRPGNLVVWRGGAGLPAPATCLTDLTI